MKTYAVTIRATITKTLEVKAENMDQAEMEAHEQFSVLNDGGDGAYEQDTMGCCVVAL